MSGETGSAGGNEAAFRAKLVPNSECATLGVGTSIQEGCVQADRKLAGGTEGQRRKGTVRPNL